MMHDVSRLQLQTVATWDLGDWELSSLSLLSPHTAQNSLNLSSCPHVLFSFFSNFLICVGSLVLTYTGVSSPAPGGSISCRVELQPVLTQLPECFQQSGRPLLAGSGVFNWGQSEILQERGPPAEGLDTPGLKHPVTNTFHI